MTMIIYRTYTAREIRDLYAYLHDDPLDCVDAPPPPPEPAASPVATPPRRSRRPRRDPASSVEAPVTVFDIFGVGGDDAPEPA